MSADDPKFDDMALARVLHTAYYEIGPDGPFRDFDRRTSDGRMMRRDWLNVAQAARDALDEDGE